MRHRITRKSQERTDPEFIVFRSEDMLKKSFMRLCFFSFLIPESVEVTVNSVHSNEDIPQLNRPSGDGKAQINATTNYLHL